ncbi:uncharacterized protein Z520_03384 [Fonsecaea multimorphosa CBS 102226]|uniref:ASST-domain-containing protein n=1 Tax=Fonsecaea multimorphosa CBS 102226 TaxID=1442371 RepID=A0A0D2KVD2_9EURO|nr:uncharacterized protein Z520_03384 [Fonsecaea multimorphosa CBS 102226]KIY00719.1 hypothetical protein Z520_03384 [Fonsecaea multimorphosa CBS 102226]OAL27763.1 hypothetical protein AYO22_03305 [Fonsecaea multimorphosa]
MWQFSFLYQNILFLFLCILPDNAQSLASDRRVYSSLLYDWGLLGPYPQQTFKSWSRTAPLLNFVRWDDSCDESGSTFLSPRGHMVSAPGPLIIDSRGELVWAEDKYGQAMDFKVQEYRGRNYLTFWTGSDTGTFGTGSYVMLDSSYQEYKTVKPANGLSGDLHEFEITRNGGTALMTIYDPTPANLSAFGIVGQQGWIYDSVFQEIDIETGALIFEWRASQHYDIPDTFHTIEAEGRRPDSSGRKVSHIGESPETAWDFFHINSVTKDEETGNYYVSSRYMHTVTCISPQGDILWILGGKRNQFTDLSKGKATNFSFQHHVRMHENNTVVTLFDNGKYDSLSKNAEYSRGIVISLDVDKMTASLVREYVHPDHRLVGSQGSIQLLGESRDHHALVGWGYVPAYTEFDARGEILCDVHLAPSIFWAFGWVKSYRAFRSSSWVGKPSAPPDVYLRPRDGKVYVSWNGATEVQTWVLQGRADTEAEMQAGLNATAENDSYRDLTSLKKSKFETSFQLATDMPRYLRIAALDRQGHVLGFTEVVDRQIGTAPSDVVGSHFIISTYCAIVVVLCLSWYLWRTLTSTRKSVPGTQDKGRNPVKHLWHRHPQSSIITGGKPDLEKDLETMPLQTGWDGDKEVDQDTCKQSNDQGVEDGEERY